MDARGSGERDIRLADRPATLGCWLVLGAAWVLGRSLVWGGWSFVGVGQPPRDAKVISGHSGFLTYGRHSYLVPTPGMLHSRSRWIRPARSLLFCDSCALPSHSPRTGEHRGLMKRTRRDGPGIAPHPDFRSLPSREGWPQHVDFVALILLATKHHVTGKAVEYSAHMLLAHRLDLVAGNHASVVLRVAVPAE